MYDSSTYMPTAVTWGTHVVFVVNLKCPLCYHSLVIRNVKCCVALLLLLRSIITIVITIIIILELLAICMSKLAND